MKAMGTDQSVTTATLNGDEPHKTRVGQVDWMYAHRLTPSQYIVARLKNDGDNARRQRR